jgi:hypothetical protein
MATRKARIGHLQSPFPGRLARLVAVVQAAPVRGCAKRSECCAQFRPPIPPVRSIPEFAPCVSRQQTAFVDAHATADLARSGTPGNKAFFVSAVVKRIGGLHGRAAQELRLAMWLLGPRATAASAAPTVMIGEKAVQAPV